MNKLFVFSILLLFLFSCASSFDNGSVVIETPKFIDSSLSKSIVKSGLGISSEDNYRFEIAIESNNKTINFITLKRNEAKSISVPANVPLSFKVGVYYAIDSDSMYEKYNMYIGTATQSDIIVANGETKEIVFDVKLNNLPVNVYLDPSFGVNDVASITSGIQGSDGVYFSLTPLVDNGIAENKIVKYSSQGFQNVLIDGINGSKFFTLKTVPGNKNVWFTTKNGLFLSDNSFSNIEAKFSWTDFSDVTDIKGFSVKAKNSDEKDRFYYLLSRGNSAFYSINYGLKANNYSWSSLAEVDLSALPSTYQFEPLLLDIEQEEFPLDNKVFFATRIGLFYLDENFFSEIISGTEPDSNKILSSIKKIIKIENPNDSKDTILIRKIKSIGSSIYLATRNGLFKIDKNSNDWKDFINSTSGSFVELKQSAISKVQEFNYDEPISTMDVLNNVLVISTPKRVWFKDLSTDKVGQVTVWDGLPFIPLKGYSNSDKINLIDYGTHFASPVKSVIYDSINNKFWFITSFGLASVDRSRIF